ncbi:MAG: class I SAM-dependent methyltransferase [Chloroflexi bacterium]|nr:class I SAM-dependent methyltransferase [Chloroflexota bacterium]MBI3732763.1 class I SAM-dependent methyltransferase [Chloroflexota bacterium]
MNVIKKVFIPTHASTRSRFHDAKGNRVDMAGLWYAPAAVLGNLLKIYFNYRPPAPWFSYRACRTLNRLIRKDWRVLEFGSGMSTLWLARRCGTLHSIEDDPQWYEVVRRLVGTGIRYELRTAAAYADLSEYPDGFFDLVLVDGLARDQCVRSSVPKVKPGGYLYLDNSDLQDEALRRAEGCVLDAVKQRHGQVRYFTDFAPTLASVTQGLLARL